MTSHPDSSTKVSLTDLTDRKSRGEKLVMVTAYDHPGARLADAAGVDIILVGDSAADNVLGYDTTVPVTVDELLVLVRAVARGTERALVVADMPFGSFQVSDETAVANAVRFVKEAGADAVKIEGAGPSLARVQALVGAGIPVMGHVGLTPQSATMLGWLQGPGPHSRESSAAVGGCARARGGGLLRGRPRGCPGRSGTSSVRHSPCPDDRYRGRT